MGSADPIVHNGWMDDALAAELAARMERDQAVRTAVQRHASAEAIDRLVEIDHENTAWLRGVLDRVGWPGNSLVSEQGALAAWLLAQHADGDLGFQRECLARPAAAVEAGEAEPSHLAYLTDRVRLAQGQPQVYGTQFWRGRDGTAHSWPSRSRTTSTLTNVGPRSGSSRWPRTVPRCASCTGTCDDVGGRQ
jgi:hypothetical protein